MTTNLVEILFHIIFDGQLYEVILGMHQPSSNLRCY
jgi:hypothetical protein